MKRLIIFTAAAMLAACQPASAPENPSQVPTATTGRPDVPAARMIASVRTTSIGLYKICDAGRAIYVADWHGTAIAIVENAAECQGMRP